MLNKAQDAAANNGNKTTRSLVSAIKVNVFTNINYFRLNTIIHLLYH